ncbi:hypothetical protein Peur_021345 [Populus x canadensis]
MWMAVIQPLLILQSYFNGRSRMLGYSESLSVVQQVHEQSKHDQFLMKLRSEFEITCSNLMNRDPLPSLDVCFGELLCEEEHLLTQGNFKQDNSTVVAFTT